MLTYHTKQAYIGAFWRQIWKQNFSKMCTDRTLLCRITRELYTKKWCLKIINEFFVDIRSKNRDVYALVIKGPGYKWSRYVMMLPLYLAKNWFFMSQYAESQKSIYSRILLPSYFHRGILVLRNTDQVQFWASACLEWLSFHDRICQKSTLLILLMMQCFGRFSYVKSGMTDFMRRPCQGYTRRMVWS